MKQFYVYKNSNGDIICRSFGAYPPPECNDQDIVYIQNTRGQDSCTTTR